MRTSIAPSQRGNAIKMLRPWKEGRTWVFDDEEAGLRKEAFVPSASGLINALIEEYESSPDEEGKITLLFSDKKFPHAVKLELMEDSFGHGITYEWVERKLEAWLCPAFYHYFDVDQVPRQLYAMTV